MRLKQMLEMNRLKNRVQRVSGSRANSSGISGFVFPWRVLVLVPRASGTLVTHLECLLPISTLPLPVIFQANLTDW